MPLPSLLDDEYLSLSRSHISAFLRTLPLEDKSLKVLEIGPKLGWPGWHTLDINEAVGATYTADICSAALPISGQTYDLVLCISVLEHVYDPVMALRNIRRIVKHSGMAAFQAPLNFRQHGPQPDLWRFTENGWRYLLRDWEDVKIDVLDSPERPLFPIAYTITARPGEGYFEGEWRPEWIER